jgi:hypothetical protein
VPPEDPASSDSESDEAQSQPSHKKRNVDVVTGPGTSTPNRPELGKFIMYVVN